MAKSDNYIKKAGKIAEVFLDILFPIKCLGGCGDKSAYLCEKCADSIPHPQNIPQKDIWSAASYKNETMREAVHAFKYSGAKKLAEPLSKLLSDRLKLSGPLQEILAKNKKEKIIIIPIPISKQRMRKRGFNQSELLAKNLSDILGFELSTNVLYKIRDTKPQAEIENREKRIKNIEGVFAAKYPEKIKNKTILLIDDVTTTGATIIEARRTLKEAGAKKVYGITLAR
jgi:ComF family protein